MTRNRDTGPKMSPPPVAEQPPMEPPFGRRRKYVELERMWDVGAVVLSGVVPGVVVAKCLAVAGALAFSSWCATIVILAAGMSHIHGQSWFRPSRLPSLPPRHPSLLLPLAPSPPSPSRASLPCRHSSEEPCTWFVRRAVLPVSGPV